MFADDTKIWRTIKDETDSIRLQQDLNNIYGVLVSGPLMIKLNHSKCKVMHIGHRVQTGYCVIEEALTKKLDETTEEKDLGIYLTDDLKATQQCTKTASKATPVLRMIKRNFHMIDVEDFRIL